MIGDQPDFQVPRVTPNHLLELTGYQSRVLQVALLPAKPAPTNDSSSTRCYCLEITGKPSEKYANST